MHITAGMFLGRYRIESLLGSGGMADVYAARDMQLGRLVALKVPRSADPARIERFVREAQLASSLNHPTIVAVYDAGSVDAIHYLAMEVVEGQTLDEWTRSTRDVRKIVEVLAAVADGLARAHAGGIVHRDLKPQNIMVARGAHPKILDFGVAKLTEADPGNGNGHHDTAPSIALGTGAYMSPEQVEGVPVDNRSDIFSFGAVMYEALTGKSPFARTTPVESMHAVLHDDPPPPGIAPELARIIRKCLVKDREERFQSIKDVAIDLRETMRESSITVPPHKPRLLPAIGALIVAAMFIAFAVLVIRDRRGGGSTLVAKPTNAAQPVMLRMTNSGNVSAGAVSPDGNYLVHATIEGENQSVWVKQIATGTNVRIIPPDRVYYTNFEVSPDGNYVYYCSASASEPNIQDLRQIPILGGESRVVAHDIEGAFGVSPDGRRVVFLRFNAFERLYRMTMSEVETGVETLLLSRPFPGMIGSMVWTPDGRSITFIGAQGEQKLRGGIFSVDIATRRIIPIPSPEWPGWGGLTWLPDGSGLLVTAAERQQPKQIWLLARDGSARKITSDISAYGDVSVTGDSKSIVTHRADMTANLWVVDPSAPSKPQPITTGLGNCFGGGGLRWLPAGRILYTVCGSTNALKIIDRKGGDPRALTRGGGYWNPAVSPDGTKMAVVTDRSGPEEIWVGDINGNESELRQLTKNNGVAYPTWAPDGQSIYYQRRGTEQTVWRVWLDGRSERVIAHPTNSPVISPDGKSILCRYRSTDPNTPLWRTAILPLDGGEPKYLEVPRHGGPPKPQWSHDGRSFFYLDYIGGVANIWKQDLRGGEARQMTRFDSGQILNYDVAADGSLAISHGERVSDVVLIRDFR